MKRVGDCSDPSGIAARALFAAACTLVLLASAAHAQSPPAGDDPAATAAARQRAERLANNPLRAILEAGRIQRRGANEATAAAAPATPPVTVAAPPTRPEPVEAVRTFTASVSTSAAIRPAAPLPLSSTPLGSLAVGVVPDLAGPLLAPRQPQLMSRADPVIPPRLLAQIGEVSRVSFDLKLRADGSVAEATLVPPAPRELQGVLGPILMQWRYVPLPGPQVHRVDLVFN